MNTDDILKRALSKFFPKKGMNIIEAAKAMHAGKYVRNGGMEDCYLAAANGSSPLLPLRQVEDGYEILKVKGNDRHPYNISLTSELLSDDWEIVGDAEVKELIKRGEMLKERMKERTDAALVMYLGEDYKKEECINERRSKEKIIKKMKQKKYKPKPLAELLKRYNKSRPSEVEQ